VGAALDANILLYAVDEGSEFHDRARRFLLQRLEGDELTYLTWDTLHEFLRIATHPAVFRSPLSASEALHNAATLVSSPRIEMLTADERSWIRFQALHKDMSVTGNLVPDAVLASILEANGIATLYTNDRDFWKFPSLRPVNPFAAA
jgi:toxin-antitoxin system PIN domain toxin